MHFSITHKRTGVLLLAAGAAIGATSGYWSAPTLDPRIYYTLNPQAQIEGPVREAYQDSQYYPEVFRLLVKKADQIAGDQLAAGNTRYYWAFLTGALTVPFHESGLEHFREFPTLGTNCINDMNTGAALARTSSGLFAVFNRFLKAAPTPLVGDCSDMDPNQSARQMSGSYDYLSVGMMQINIYAHEDTYAASMGFTSVPNTIDYGLRFYSDGFDSVFHHALDGRYPCLESSSSPDGVDYQNLIRGAWAGQYNSGNVGQTCRFQDPGSAWAANDIQFQNSLQSVLNGGGVYQNDLTGVELAAYHEIIGNLRNGTNQMTNLSQILAGAATAPVTQPTPMPTPAPTATPTPQPTTPTPNVIFTAKVGGDYVNIRSVPVSGNILRVARKGDPLQIIAIQSVSGSFYPWYQTPNGWIYGQYVSVGG